MTPPKPYGFDPSSTVIAVFVFALIVISIVGACLGAILAQHSYVASRIPAPVKRVGLWTECHLGDAHWVIPTDGRTTCGLEGHVR